MTRMSVPSGDATLSVLVEGRADGPPLLLSNSLAADLHMWDAQMPALCERHRVIRYDTRGHGQSSAPPGPYSFATLVADMVAVLDHLAVERADVMGLSLGGMTALGLGLTHPERVGRMVVCDARADAPAAFVASWDDRIATITAGGMGAIAEGTLGRWFSQDCRPRCAPGRSDDPRDLGRRLHRLRAGVAGAGLPARSARMAVPVLYVVGADDLAAPREAMAAMAAATPGATLAVLPGLAHVPNMERPDLFNAAVGPWLAETVTTV